MKLIHTCPLPPPVNRFGMGARLLRRILFLGLAAVIAPCFAGASSILMNDTFADGSRTNQALPGSAAWYASAVGSQVTVVNQQLRVNTANNNSAVLAYFEPVGSSVTLSSGNSLQLSFDFSLTGPLAPQDRAFGFFLYYSGGKRLAADDTSGFNTTANNTLFGAYSGYGITYDPDSVNSRYRTVERTLVNQSLLTSNANVPLGGAKSSAILTAGKTYTASLDLVGNASSVTVSGNINGSLISNVDSSGPFRQFDTVVIYGLGTDIKGMTLDNIEVTLTGVPEPSTYGLLAFGAMLLLLLRTRYSQDRQRRQAVVAIK